MDMARDRFLGHRARRLDLGARQSGVGHSVSADGAELRRHRRRRSGHFEGVGKPAPRRWRVSHHGWGSLCGSDRTMSSGQASSRIFAYRRIDILPVLAALGHSAFNVNLIIGFAGRPRWHSALLGSIYAVAISWNINGVSHNFIHTPYFKPRW